MRYILVGLFLMFITACSSVKYEREVVNKYTYLKTDVPASLFRSCKPKPPLDAKSFGMLSEQGRELYLTGYVIELLGEVKKCDTKLQGVKRFIDKQNSLIPESGAIIGEL